MDRDRAPLEDLLHMIGRLPTRRCVTTVFCVNANVLESGSLLFQGPQVAESGFSHIVEWCGARTSGSEVGCVGCQRLPSTPPKRETRGSETLLEVDCQLTTLGPSDRLV